MIILRMNYDLFMTNFVVRVWALKKAAIAAFFSSLQFTDLLFNSS